MNCRRLSSDSQEYNETEKPKSNNSKENLQSFWNVWTLWPDIYLRGKKKGILIIVKYFILNYYRNSTEITWELHVKYPYTIFWLIFHPFSYHLLLSIQSPHYMMDFKLSFKDPIFILKKKALSVKSIQNLVMLGYKPPLIFIAKPSKFCFFFFLKT